MGRALEAAAKGGVLDDVVGGVQAYRLASGGLAEEIERLRAEPGEGDIAIGGATLAAEAAALGLIDEYRAVVYPVLVGGGIPFFPQRERRVDLDLVETRTFSSRVVYLRYRGGALTQTAARPAAKRGHAPAGRAEPALELKEPEACCCVLPPRGVQHSCSERRDLTTEVCYRPGADGPRRRRSGRWWALPDVAWTEYVTSCVWLVGPRIWAGWWHARYPGRGVVSTGPEAFQVGLLLRLGADLGIDAVGGPPYCNVADEGGARVASRWCPDWLRVILAGMILDLVGEVGDQLGSLCQVGPPARMATERFWNAWEPGQRTCGGRRASSGRRQ